MRKFTHHQSFTGKTEAAIELFVQGKATLGEASAIAGRRKLMDLLACRGIDSGIRPEGLKAAEKVLR